MNEEMDIHSMKRMLAKMPKETRARLLAELKTDSEEDQTHDRLDLIDDEKVSQSQSGERDINGNAAFPNDQILKTRLSNESKKISGIQYLSCFLWLFTGLCVLALITYGLKSAVDWLGLL